MTIRRIRKLDLLVVTTVAGGGVAGDPIREVQTVITADGRIVAEYDPAPRDWVDEQHAHGRHDMLGELLDPR